MNTKGRKNIQHEQIDSRLEQFDDYLKRKGLARNTIAVYHCAVRQYFSLHNDLNVDTLQSYKQFLLSHYKPATANIKIYGINSYLKSLEQPSKTAPPRASAYKLPAVHAQTATFLDNVISQEDYEHLKNSLKKDRNMYWYFVVRFLASTGARVSELIQIRLEYLKLGYMDLYSKGGKVRRIYFPRSLCEEALSWFQQNGVESGFIFLNRSHRPITPRGVHWRLKKLAVRYGIDPATVYPHSFRHRFAQNFLERFHDISLLADLMGHESIETTRIYLTKSSREQKEIIDQIITW